jgi:protein arginine N-methyltransferase 1
MYTLDEYGRMIADAGRIDAYVEALRRTVRRESVVLDLGTGTGFFAIAAARLGARRVFAIESADVIELAREIARDNGLGEVIDFIQGDSAVIELPQRADVIVADLHGTLPHFGSHLPTMADARDRFLAPGGAMIPQSDTLWMASVEAPELHRFVSEPWSNNGLAIDMSAARRLQANLWRSARIRAEQMVSTPQCWGTVDYRSLRHTDASACVTLRAQRDATAHGLCAWFDTTVADGIEISNAPGAPALVYGHAFFPWPEAVPLVAGDVATVRIAAKLVQRQYVWTWETSIERREKTPLRFMQSDFLAAPLAISRLSRRAADFVPSPNEDASIDGAILDLIVQCRSLGDIAREVARRHPERFPRWEEALARVGELSLRYSR